MLNQMVVNVETVEQLWQELKMILPRIKSELLKDQDVCIFNGDVYPSIHMGTEYRDLVLRVIGPMQDLPFIHKDALHGNSEPGYGAVLYKCREIDLHYVVAYVRGKWGETVPFLVCKRNESARVILACKRQEKKALEVNVAPILEEGILDDIIANTIGFLRKSKEISKYGVRMKRGVILDGDPGNGKSMVCRYIKKLCVKHNIGFGVVTAAEIEKAYNDRVLTALFQRYEVTFFDDIDISFMNRKSGNGKMATSLLTAMDGMDKDENLVRIFTTNEKIADLDPAFVRPGRIDKCITLPKPNRILRQKLIESWPKEIQDSFEMQEIISRTDNFSFADLESIRTIMVSQKVLMGQDWNLELALETHGDRTKKSTKVGF